MDLETLSTIWFALVALLFVLYAVTDGFDLGVGILQPFLKDERERDLNASAIGPLWDGHEVWLIAAGGALFAAFPKAYATAFSGMYTALMFVVISLILRGVSLEFRHHAGTPGLKRLCDLGFGIGSLLVALLLGVAFGNVLIGVDVDSDGLMRTGLLGLLRPAPLAWGVAAVALAVLHGTVFLSWRLTGLKLASRNRLRASILFLVALVLLLAAVGLTGFERPALLAGMSAKWPALAPCALLLLAGMALLPWALKQKKGLIGLLASGAQIAGLVGSCSALLFPVLLPSTRAPAWDLVTVNCASTPYSLSVMLIILGIGLPLIALWFTFLYRAFLRGPVKTGAY